MSNEVIISAKADLNRVMASLQQLEKQASHVGDALGRGGNDIEKSLKGNSSKVERYLNQLADLGRRTADQLRGDFKTIFNVDGLKAKFNGTNMLKESVAGAVKLSDAVRKVGRTFGLAENEFASFQANVVRGLREIGLGSEEATRSLSGIAQTQVRGEDNVIALARQASELAGIGGQEGQEGALAKGIADVVQTRGGNVNDPAQLREVAEATRRTSNVTGKSPTAVLDDMRKAFEGMATDFRAKMGPQGLANVQAAGAIAGPGAQKALETLMNKSKLDRLPVEMQGFSGVIGDKGLDMDKFERVMKGIVGRIGFDPRASAKTLGIGDDEAEGLLRLYEQRQQVRAAQMKVNGQGGNLTEQYQQSRGLGQAVQANVNRAVGGISAELGRFTQGATTFFNETAKDEKTSKVVTGGMAALAAVTAGGALYSILKAPGGAAKVGKGVGDITKTAGTALAAEQVFGQKTMPVFVVNMPDGGLLGGAAGVGGGPALTESMGKLSKAADIMAKVGMITAVGALGYDVGKMLEPAVTQALDTTTMGKNSDGYEGNVGERIMFALDKFLGGQASTEFIRNKQAERALDAKEESNRLLRSKKQNTDPAKRGSTGGSQ